MTGQGDPQVPLGTRRCHGPARSGPAALSPPCPHPAGCPHLSPWLSITFTLVCFSIPAAGAPRTPPGDGCSAPSYFVTSYKYPEPFSLAGQQMRAPLVLPFLLFLRTHFSASCALFKFFSPPRCLSLKVRSFSRRHSA